MATPSRSGIKQRALNKFGFNSNNQLWGFLSVVMAGQIIYSAFEAFKGTFYDLLLKVLGVSNAQLGVIFSLIGISVFFYIPGGWINNRFSVKSILITGLLIRMLTVFIIVFLQPSFTLLRIIAIIWGLTDAFFWPAVLNGVSLLSDKNHSGLAFGLLESIRRAAEMLMNLLLVGAMALFGGISIFKTGMLVYNLLIIPLVIAIIKFVPSNGIAAETGASQTKKASEALKGLLKVLLMPKVWLASITALTIYWSYINLIYTVPYLQAVYHISQTQASIFGIINTGAMGVVAGIISGSLSDYVFKSSSRMMFVALILTFIALIAVLLLPKNQQTLWPSIILLMLFSFAIFLAKSIILAPIAESGIPEKYSGSSMSVGSFAAYAPVFWAYSTNGHIIDTHKDAIAAYQQIFLISVVVAGIGVITAFFLTLSNRKQKTA
ncbi:MFS transporter [Agrilactobacillus fermenti]|uniref:MFS transporter n=1 Tax=Agrilactobacillus fermenti TaxID=2586909 RepID=UPI001E5A6FDA|nr:MFS transporter [Agrilactobacillus fermenti]MCD2255608.1 MFS transporter [Agrilactobacillus fermenti]